MFFLVFLVPLVPLFWISGGIYSGFQSQSGSCLIHFFAEANVMYIPRDPPLVLHVPTSWWLGTWLQYKRGITRTEDEGATIVPATRLPD